MASSQNIGIYINNFDTQCPNQETLAQLTGYASDIGSAGYTTGIFWAMHLNAYGDFIYNGGYPEPMISKGKLQPGFSYLPGLCPALRSGGNINKLYFLCRWMELRMRFRIHDGSDQEAWYRVRQPIAPEFPGAQIGVGHCGN